MPHKPQHLTNSQWKEFVHIARKLLATYDPSLEKIRKSWWEMQGASAGDHHSIPGLSRKTLNAIIPAARKYLRKRTVPTKLPGLDTLRLFKRAWQFAFMAGSTTIPAVPSEFMKDAADAYEENSILEWGSEHQNTDGEPRGISKLRAAEIRTLEKDWKRLQSQNEDYTQRMKTTRALDGGPLLHTRLEHMPNFIRARTVSERLASYYETRQQFSKAAIFLDELADLHDAVHDPIYASRARLRALWAHYECGRYTRVVDDAWELIQRLGGANGSAGVCMDLRTVVRLQDLRGLATLRIAQTERAMRREAAYRDRLLDAKRIFENESMPLRKTIGAVIGTAVTAGRLGLVLTELNQNDRNVDKHFLSAFQKAYSWGAMQAAFGVLYNYAILLFRRSNFVMCWHLLEQCIAAQQLYGDTAAEAKSRQVLGGLAYQLALKLPDAVPEKRPGTRPVVEFARIFPQFTPMAPLCVDAMHAAEIQLSPGWDTNLALRPHHEHHEELWRRARSELNAACHKSAERCRPEVYASGKVGLGWIALLDGDGEGCRRHYSQASMHVADSDAPKARLHSQLNHLAEAFRLRLGKAIKR